MLTKEDLLEIVKPHHDRIIAESRAESAEKRLIAANRIIAEQLSVLAQAHAALQSLIEAADALVECVDQVERARVVTAKIEGRAS